MSVSLGPLVLWSYVIADWLVTSPAWWAGFIGVAFMIWLCYGLTGILFAHVISLVAEDWRRHGVHFGYAARIVDWEVRRLWQSIFVAIGYSPRVMCLCPIVPSKVETRSASGCAQCSAGDWASD